MVEQQEQWIQMSLSETQSFHDTDKASAYSGSAARTQQNIADNRQIPVLPRGMKIFSSSAKQHPQLHL